MSWTGYELQEIQADLTLTVEAFAWLLGVGVSTLYRWYGYRASNAPVSGGSRHLLVLIDAWRAGPRGNPELAELRVAVLKRDTLATLQLLTSHVRKSA